MKRVALLSLCLFASTGWGQTIVTVPAPSCSAVVTCQSVQLTIPATPPPPVTCVAPQVLQSGVCVTPVVTPPPVTCTPPAVLQNGACVTPVVTPPAAGVAWVFHNGVTTSLFGGDYSFGSGWVSYTTKDPQTGETVVGVFGDEGWQPYFTGNDFNTNGYKYVLVSLKATVAGQNWLTGAEMNGDKPIPNGPATMQPIAPYCSAFAIGVWMACKIPLSLYGIPTGDFHLYKFAFLQHATPVPAGKLNWEAKEYGLSP